MSGWLTQLSSSCVWEGSTYDCTCNDVLTLRDSFLWTCRRVLYEWSNLYLCYCNPKQCKWHFVYIPENVVHCLGQHHIFFFQTTQRCFTHFFLVSTCAVKTDPCSQAALLEHLRRSKSTSQPPDFVPCPEVLSFFSGIWRRKCRDTLEYINVWRAAWYVHFVYT